MQYNLKNTFSKSRVNNKKNKIIEYIKFNAIGISNFLISQIIYLCLYLVFKLNYLVAYSVTSIISIIVSYLLNSKYTFKNKDYSTKKLALTIIIYIFEYALNFAMIWAFVNYLNISEVIAPFVAPLFSTIPVFFMMRSVIKKKNNKKTVSK